MTKKHFIALADAIRDHNQNPEHTPFNAEHLATLRRFCREQNGQFKGERWEGYIFGHNGKNGGAVKNTTTFPR